MDEVIIGAPGSGLFGMLLFALVAVFVAGLMVPDGGSRFGRAKTDHPGDDGVNL
jgi:K+-transporting ATPase A subunit